MLDQNLFIFPPKNAHGRNDRDYNCDRNTYLKVLDIISSIGLILIETTVSMFQEGLQKKKIDASSLRVKLFVE